MLRSVNVFILNEYDDAECKLLTLSVLGSLIYRGLDDSSDEQGFVCLSECVN